MKEILAVLCCGIGSGMIGYFANRLNTVVGCVCFALGIVILVASITVLVKSDKKAD